MPVIYAEIFTTQGKYQKLSPAKTVAPTHNCNNVNSNRRKTLFMCCRKCKNNLILLLIPVNCL